MCNLLVVNGFLAQDHRKDDHLKDLAISPINIRPQLGVADQCSMLRCSLIRRKSIGRSPLVPDTIVGSMWFIEVYGVTRNPATL